MKTLSLFQGVSLLKELGTTQIKVIGDSSIIIKHVRFNTAPKYIALRQIISCIQIVGKSCEEIKYFYVLRDLNFRADKRANEAIGMREGEL